MPPRFPLFIDLAGSPCLVVGAGPVALRRCRTLLQCGAEVRVVAPSVHADFCQLSSAAVRIETRIFAETDLEGMRLCVAATNDLELNRHIAALCMEQRIPVNVASDAALGTFHFPALVCRDNVVLGIHAGGQPSLAKRLRAWLDKQIPDHFENLP